MVSNTSEHDFKATLGAVEPEKGGVKVSKAVAKALGIAVGDKVRYCA